MTPLDILVIIVLVGAIVILLYFYMKNNKNISFTKARSFAVETGGKARSTVSGASEKIKEDGKGTGRVVAKMSGMGEKARTVVTGVDEKVSGTGDSASEGSMMDSVTEKVSGVSEKIKGTVKSVPKSTSKSTDSLSKKIDVFLDDKSDQLIKDWELATKDDILDIENRYTKVSRDLDTLDNKFIEYRGSTNNKLKQIEERLDKLESPE